MHRDERGTILTVPISDTSNFSKRAPASDTAVDVGRARLLMAWEMSLFARELAKEGIREQHPQWSDAEVARELIRRAFPPGQVPAFLR
jgi:hypothetical protein